MGRRKPWREPSAGGDSTDSLIWDSAASRTLGYKCLLFKPPGLCYFCYSCPSWFTHKYFNSPMNEFGSPWSSWATYPQGWTFPTTPSSSLLVENLPSSSVPRTVSHCPRVLPYYLPPSFLTRSSKLQLPAPSLSHFVVRWHISRNNRWMNTYGSQLWITNFYLYLPFVLSPYPTDLQVYNLSFLTFSKLSHNLWHLRFDDIWYCTFHLHILYLLTGNSFRKEPTYYCMYRFFFTCLEKVSLDPPYFLAWRINCSPGI